MNIRLIDIYKHALSDVEKIKIEFEKTHELSKMNAKQFRILDKLDSKIKDLRYLVDLEEEIQKEMKKK